MISFGCGYANVDLDTKYSGAQRQLAAGHADAATFVTFYQSPQTEVDGQALLLDTPIRPIIRNTFMELTVHRSTNLSCTLPAKLRHTVEQSDEYHSLQRQISQLKATAHSLDTKKELKRLKSDRTKLMQRMSRDWQAKHADVNDKTPNYQQHIFRRCRFMLPELDFIEQHIFKADILRSPLALHIIKHMMALYDKSSEVTHRPGLDPAQLNIDVDPKSWHRCYTTYKKTLMASHPFAEFCFTCNNWYSTSEAWEDHCTDHLQSLSDFSTFLDPIVHDGILAMPGFCYFCLTNAKLPASERMHQWLHRAKWIEHNRNHLYELPEGRNNCHWVTCSMFEATSKLDLMFHLEDVHHVIAHSRQYQRHGKQAKPVKKMKIAWRSRQR